MIHTHSLGRAARYYPERVAIASGGTRLTFRELNDHVASIAAALRRHGFGVGDRLAILLPNEPEYIELVYACSWLGVIAVPLNARDCAFLGSADFHESAIFCGGIRLVSLRSALK